jgi:hypothetical protein
VRPEEIRLLQQGGHAWLHCAAAAAAATAPGRCRALLAALQYRWCPLHHASSCTGAITCTSRHLSYPPPPPNPPPKPHLPHPPPHPPQASWTSEYEIKKSWWTQLFKVNGDSAEAWDVSQHFPNIKLINWFDIVKEESMSEGNNVNWAISMAQDEAIPFMFLRFLTEPMESMAGRRLAQDEDMKNASTLFTPEKLADRLQSTYFQILPTPGPDPSPPSPPWPPMFPSPPSPPSPPWPPFPSGAPGAFRAKPFNLMDMLHGIASNIMGLALLGGAGAAALLYLLYVSAVRTASARWATGAGVRHIA